LFLAEQAAKFFLLSKWQSTVNFCGIQRKIIPGILSIVTSAVYSLTSAKAAHPAFFEFMRTDLLCQYCIAFYQASPDFRARIG
jgi:hypothetical protein